MVAKEIIMLPNKEKARGLLAYAVKRGKVKRGNCEVCGKENAQGHHMDYSKPLEVMWLCEKHHGKWHAENPKVPGYSLEKVVKISSPTYTRLREAKLKSGVPITVIITRLVEMNLQKFMKGK